MSRNGMILAGLGVVAFVAVLYLALAPGDAPFVPAEPEGPGLGTGSRPAVTDSSGGRAVPLVAPSPAQTMDMVEMILLALRGEGPGLPEGEMERVRDTDEGVKAILSIIQGDHDADTRAAAIFMLGASRFGPAVDVVERGVRGEFGAELRTAAIVSMVGAEPQRAFPILESVFLTDMDKGVSTAALQALAMHWDRQAALEAWEGLLARAPEGDRKAFLYLGLGGMIPPMETEEPSAIRDFRRTLRGIPPLGGLLVPEEEEIYGRMLEMAVAETRKAYRAPAAVFVARLPGEASREAFLKIWNEADAPERDHLVGLLHPQIGGVKLADFVRMGPTMKTLDYRRIISGHLETWPDPSLIPDIETWAVQEQDAEVREKLEQTIRRLRGR